MMGWERPLMLRHAELICPGAVDSHTQLQPAEGIEHGPGGMAAAAAVAVATDTTKPADAAEGLQQRQRKGRILNVGFGLGIVDTAIQVCVVLLHRYTGVLLHVALTWWCRPVSHVNRLHGWRDVLLLVTVRLCFTVV